MLQQVVEKRYINVERKGERERKEKKDNKKSALLYIPQNDLYMVAGNKHVTTYRRVD